MPFTSSDQAYKNHLLCNEAFAFLSFAYSLHNAAVPPYPHILTSPLECPKAMKKALADQLEAHFGALVMSNQGSQAERWACSVFRRLIPIVKRDVENLVTERTNDGQQKSSLAVKAMARLASRPFDGMSRPCPRVAVLIPSSQRLANPLAAIRSIQLGTDRLLLMHRRPRSRQTRLGQTSDRDSTRQRLGRVASVARNSSRSAEGKACVLVPL
jgi:hypothetical protein